MQANVSYASLYGIHYDESDQDISVGDIVYTGLNEYPTFEVIAIVDARVWLRSTTYRTDHIVDLKRCKRLTVDVNR